MINRREFMIAVAGGVLSTMAGDRDIAAELFKKDVSKGEKTNVSLVKTSDRVSGIKRVIKLLGINPIKGKDSRRYAVRLKKILSLLKVFRS